MSEPEKCGYWNRPYTTCHPSGGKCRCSDITDSECNIIEPAKEEKSADTPEREVLFEAISYIIENTIGCDICINQYEKSCKRADCQKALEQSFLAQARKK